jgi:molybdate transport system permease protein
VPGADLAVARLAVVSVLLSVAALIASELLVRRSHGRRAHVL